MFRLFLKATWPEGTGSRFSAGFPACAGPSVHLTPFHLLHLGEAEEPAMAFLDSLAARVLDATFLQTVKGTEGSLGKL